MLIQVIAGALAVVIGVAVAGAFASRRVAERESVTDAAHTTDLIARQVVQPAITNGLISGNPAALAAIDRVVRHQVLSSSVVRVKLWTATGRIVYSDEPRLIGQTFPLGSQERAALARPSVHAEVSNLDRPENKFERGRGKLLEVYRPVWAPLIRFSSRHKMGSSSATRISRLEMVMPANPRHSSPVRWVTWL